MENKYIRKINVLYYTETKFEILDRTLVVVADNDMQRKLNSAATGNSGKERKMHFSVVHKKRIIMMIITRSVLVRVRL